MHTVKPNQKVTCTYIADNKAISKFVRDFTSHPNLPAAAGAVGLSIKAAVEQSTNSLLYPKIGKMSFQHTPFSIKEERKFTPRLKRHKLSDQNRNVTESSAMDVDNTDDCGASGSQEGATRSKRSAEGMSSGKGAPEGNMRGSALLPVGLRSIPFGGKRIFTKQYRLRLHNGSLVVRNYKGAINKYNALRYPYYDLPVNMLGFYCTKEEIQELQQYTSARVKEVNVEVFIKTAVLTFETNATTSNIGNNNIGVYLNIFSRDLNSKRFGKFGQKQSSVIENVFWGRHASKFEHTTTAWQGTEVGKLGAEFLTRNYDNRFEYYSTYESGDLYHNHPLYYLLRNFF